MGPSGHGSGHSLCKSNGLSGGFQSPSYISEVYHTIAMINQNMGLEYWKGFRQDKQGTSSLSASPKGPRTQAGGIHAKPIPRFRILGIHTLQDNSHQSPTATNKHPALSVSNPLEKNTLIPNILDPNKSSFSKFVYHVSKGPKNDTPAESSLQFQVQCLLELWNE